MLEKMSFLLIDDNNTQTINELITVLNLLDFNYQKTTSNSLSNFDLSEFNALIVPQDIFNNNPNNYYNWPTIVLTKDNNVTNSNSKTVTSLNWPCRYNDLIELFYKFYNDDTHSQKLNAVGIDLIGNSDVIKNIRRLIFQVAQTDVNVLILGESGTGKELVARSIHALSNRNEHSLIPVNCGAIPKELLESELFGHEKGAFTGAISSRAGRYELAQNGTLFLDEIGDMPMPMQVKLLRVLQDKTFHRVGSNKVINADVRIISATHKNLEQAITKEEFREDLFYRLNVFPIEMPPLRARCEDIPILINYILSNIARDCKKTIHLTPTATDCLCTYAWPGNVRELQNLIERLVVLFPNSVVGVDSLPEKYRANYNNSEQDKIVVDSLARFDTPVINFSANNPIDLKEHLSELEATIINKALTDSGGVVAKAAKLLSMKRTTLVEKIKKYSIN